MNTSPIAMNVECQTLNQVLDPTGLDIDLEADILLAESSSSPDFPLGLIPLDLIFDLQNAWLAN